jgi:hypothetical protein
MITGAAYEQNNMITGAAYEQNNMITGASYEQNKNELTQHWIKAWGK